MDERHPLLDRYESNHFQSDGKGIKMSENSFLAMKRGIHFHNEYAIIKFSLMYQITPSCSFLVGNRIVVFS